MNMVMLSGNVVSDAKFVEADSEKGIFLTKFRMANNRKLANDKTQTLYINVDLWNAKLELKTADSVIVKGTLRMDEYRDKEGNDRVNYYVTADYVWKVSKITNIE